MKKKFVCPWWMGYILANPLRKLTQNPEQILAPYISEGVRILEVGPGMGFFTLSMARMAGAKGKVYAVDVQDKMLAVLKKRAEKAGISERIETRIADGTSLPVKDLAGSIDFALLFAVVHEVPDVPGLFKEIYSALKPGGKILFSEPSGHVNKSGFSESIKAAENAGFRVIDTPHIRMEHSAVLQK